MKKVMTYQEYEEYCLKNRYSKANYEHLGEKAEEHMKRAYEGYLFRYNALKQVEEYEENIRKKYRKMEDNTQK